MEIVLIKEVLDLLSSFEQECDIQQPTIADFKQWIINQEEYDLNARTVDWEGRLNGRSPESVINTMILHMGRYAKSYSKSIIHESQFISQEDFIYLINLKAFGRMSKMELIKKNVHEKPIGMQIINRLLALGFIHQIDSPTDKRSKLIEITPLGLEELEAYMPKIRQATHIVTGDLTPKEKLELIRLLTKLDKYHRPIYDKNINTKDLLDEVWKQRS